MLAGSRWSLPLALLFLLSLGSIASAEAPWKGFTGTSFLELNPAMLRSLGIEVSVVETGERAAAATSPLGARAEAFAFSVLPRSSVRVRRNGGYFKGFESGSLRHAGGVVLTLPDGSLSLLDFSLRAAEPAANFDLLDAAGRRWLILANMHWESSADGSQLWLLGADVLLAPELAERLGRPDLTEAYLGLMDIALPSPPPAKTDRSGSSSRRFAAASGPCDPDLGLPKDVELIGIAQLSQVAREPGGRVSMAPSAQLRNAGVGAIPWYQTIEPDAPAASIGDHPYLAMHFYRQVNGAIEQIGRSDLKHAFYSVNTNCTCPAGHIIYPTCEDTYGVNTNFNTIHFAPRHELSASTGLWERVGSHFDDLPVDDFRDHQGSIDHDDYEHLLVVSEPELETPGASYFIEAWYIIQDDVNIWNSMGHRAATPSRMGNTWSFALGGTVPTQGSVLDEWVDPVSPPAGTANTTIDTGTGHLQLAASTTDLGGGVTAYEYALMNFDFDAEIRAFRVPLVPGTVVTNVGFRGADKDPLGDWIAVVGGDNVTWTAPAGEELDWGTLFNFRFEADAPPVSSAIELGISDPSAGTAMAMASVGPAPAPLCSDGMDNDGDSLIDFAATGGDPGCQRPSSPIENPQCQDGIDNDGDGFTDFDAGLSAGGPVDPDGPDPQCTSPFRTAERSSLFCAIGAELLLVLPLLAVARARRARQSR